MTAQAADWLSLPSHRIAVVLIDFQNDFCNPDAGRGRPPTNTHNEAAARRADTFAAAASTLAAPIVSPRQRPHPRPLGPVLGPSGAAHLGRAAGEDVPSRPGQGL